MQQHSFFLSPIRLFIKINLTVLSRCSYIDFLLLLIITYLFHCHLNCYYYLGQTVERSTNVHINTVTVTVCHVPFSFISILSKTVKRILFLFKLPLSAFSTWHEHSTNVHLICHNQLLLSLFNNFLFFIFTWTFT